MQLSGTQYTFIKGEIDAAKTAARAVLDFARSNTDPPVNLGEIAGADPRVLLDFARSSSERAEGLRAIRTHLGPAFFCRVVARSRIDRGFLRQQFLFTKARFPGSINLDDAETVVLPWTSPLYVTIRGSRPGETVEVRAPRGTAQHQVEASGDWRSLLPEAEGIVIRTPLEDLRIESETLLRSSDGLTRKSVAPDRIPTSDAVPAAKPSAPPAVSERPIPRTATPDPEPRSVHAPRAPVPREFGLGEIIALADATQRSAMHLPFSDDVLVDGPPGSGKTSVGLMRIPCLIDRQWHERGLTFGKDRPFHEDGSMRVLVMNREMVPYLERLMRDVGIQRVPVETLGDFCRELCKKSPLQPLAGVPRPSSPELERLKLSRKGLQAFVTATRESVTNHWYREESKLRRKLRSVHESTGEFLWSMLESWVKALKNWQTDPMSDDRALHICQRIHEWGRREIDSPERNRERPDGRRIPKPPSPNEIRRLIAMAETFLRGALDRAAILRSLPDVDDATGSLMSEWRRQVPETKGGLATYSSADVALHGLSTSKFLLSRLPTSESPLIGGILPRLTHVLIDEAQDVSPIHVMLLRSLLGAEGTLTMVGDLRQRVDEACHFEDWSELPLRTPRRATFSVNHRQTTQLGSFVRAEYERLYGERAGWIPSDRPGADVRVAPCLSGDQLPMVVRELRHWLQRDHDSSCGVLFIDDLEPPALQEARAFIERGLQDMLVPVQLALPDQSEGQLRGDAGVVIAPVALTKGLEFDVIVLISRAHLATAVQRNRHYVGCSRARTGLSVVTPAFDLPPGLIRPREGRSGILGRLLGSLGRWLGR